MKTLAEIINALQTIAVTNGAHKAILFGSYAHGSATKHSAVDVIVREETAEPFLKRIDKYLYPLVDLLAESVGVLVYTLEEFVHMQKRPFIKRIIAEDNIVYEH